MHFASIVLDIRAIGLVRYDVNRNEVRLVGERLADPPRNLCFSLLVEALVTVRFIRHLCCNSYGQCFERHDFFLNWL